MRGIRWTIGVWALSAWVAGEAAAQAPDYFVQVRGRGWMARPRGDVRSSTATVTGTKVDFVRDLDLARRIVPDGEITFRPRPVPMRLTLSAWTGTFEGSNTTTPLITFDGTTYVVGGTLRSEFETLDISARWAYEFGIPVEPTEAIFALGAGAKYLSLTGRVRGTQFGTGATIRESGGGEAVIPLLGFTLEVPIMGYVELEGSVWGFPTLSIGNVRGGYVEAAAGLKLFPVPAIFLEGGYRIQRLIFQRRGRFDLNTRLDGFYAGLGARM